MIEWKKELWFYTPRGLGLVIACQPCGINGDMEWTCIIAETGEVRNYKNYEVRAAKNETYGINLDKNMPEANKWEIKVTPTFVGMDLGKEKDWSSTLRIMMPEVGNAIAEYQYIKPFKEPEETWYERAEAKTYPNKFAAKFCDYCQLYRSYNTNCRYVSCPRYAK